MNIEKFPFPIPKHLIPKLKDSGILLGWIAGLILIGSLSWFFTQPVRNTLLIKAINKVFEQNGDSRRLAAYIPAKSAGMGSWFSMTEFYKRHDSGTAPLADGTRAYVFVFIADGSFFPCVAVVSPEGRVEEFIPLSNHGQRMIKRSSAGIMSLYASRIEGFES